MDIVESIQIAREAIGHALRDISLTVPVHQRFYAWEESHVTELYQDLANAISIGEKEYFLGSIVVTRNERGQPEVVDGQQRLATITILLAAIRDYFFNAGDKVRSSDIEHTFLMSRDLRTKERLPKLTLNEVDNDFFKKRIISPPNDPDRGVEAVKDSHRRIQTAADVASKHVTAIIQTVAPENRADRLLDWMDFIEKGARVIWVTVPDHANAFVIFETLNDRGLALSISDLLKNYLFGHSENRITETQQRWFSMIGAIEAASSEEDVVTYIRHYWSSRYGLTRERDLYASIKAKVKSKQSCVDFATELAKNANLYAALLNSDHALWNNYGTSSRKHLATLNLLRIEQMRPLLLAVLEHFSPVEVRKCLKLMVCWSVRFLIAGGVGSGTLEKYYADRALEVRANRIADTTGLTKAMASVVPGNADFESAFAIARVSKSFLARYYLRALEQQSSGDLEPELIPSEDEGTITLEHILPESPTTEWSHIDAEKAQALYKRIGNMVLLKATPNSDLGNAGFDAKRKVFKTSKYKLTKGLASKTKWDEKEIIERQKALAKIAVKTWPLRI